MLGNRRSTKVSQKTALFADVALTLGAGIFTVLAGTLLVSIPPAVLGTPRLELVEIRGIGFAAVCLVIAASALFLRERISARWRASRDRKEGSS